MKGCIERSDKVRRDLAQIFAVIGRSNPRAADRFLLAAEKTFRQLAEMPGTGEILDSDDIHLLGVRRRLVEGFKNHLVIDKPVDGGILILRVIHAARDTEDLVDPEDVS